MNRHRLGSQRVGQSKLDRAAAADPGIAKRESGAASATRVDQRRLPKIEPIQERRGLTAAVQRAVSVLPFGVTESAYDESNPPADQTVKPICG
jgi:hypothetical protein